MDEINRSCGKKRKHGTQESAQLQVAQLRQSDSDPRNIKSLVAYRCRFCRYWHVGHDRYRSKVPA